MAFTLQERQALGIHGLLPPRFKTQEEQVRLCKENVERYHEDLNKHIYLVGLQVGADLSSYTLVPSRVSTNCDVNYYCFAGPK
jgi:malate dehydrogenase (oxaloacetate-decarboxylating)(NADP+)